MSRALLPAVSLAAVPGRRRATLELAAEIERRGFSGIYCPSFGDGLSLCLALAFATREIPFGTSIVPIYSRSAEELAPAVSFIHEVSGGRFAFGVGVSHAPALARVGVRPGPPIADMRGFASRRAAVPRAGALPPLILAALRVRQRRSHRVGQPDGFSGAVDQGDLDFGPDDRPAVAFNALAEDDPGAAGSFKPCGNHEHIVDRRGREKIDLHARNGERESLVGKFVMMHALEAQEISPSAFHEMQEPGMIDAPGKIRVLEIDPLAQFVAVPRQAAGKVTHRRHR